MAEQVDGNIPLTDVFVLARHDAHKHWTGYRAQRHSTDGDETWSELKIDNFRPCFMYQGRIISLSERANGVHNALVTSNPCPLGGRLIEQKREPIVPRMSTDCGRTWTMSHMIEPARSAYSTLVEIDEQRISIPFERGTRESRRPRISFRSWYRSDYRY